MARLGGWNRIGIIVSVVWILGAGIYTYEWMADNYDREAWLQGYKCKEAERDRRRDDLTQLYPANKHQTESTEADQELERLASPPKPKSGAKAHDVAPPTVKEWDAQGNPIVSQPGLPPGLVPDPTGELVCDEQALAYRASRKGRQLCGAVVVAFVPLPLGWGFVYLIFFLVRWVKRGFISPGNSN
jgi:hypothetical protein